MPGLRSSEDRIRDSHQSLPSPPKKSHGRERSRPCTWLRIQAKKMALEQTGTLKKAKDEQRDQAGVGSVVLSSLSVTRPVPSQLVTSTWAEQATSIGERWEIDSGISSGSSLPPSGRSSPCPCMNPSKLVAMDCEMVGTGPGGQCSEVARCSLVGYHGDVLYDHYIKPLRPVVDYRTRWSGICRHHLVNAVPFSKARQEIIQLLKGKIIVGHALHNDFKVLGFVPPRQMIRDTCQSHDLRCLAGIPVKGGVSLKRLAKVLLKRNIQCSKLGHSSVEDAGAAMDLYRLVEAQWEERVASAGLGPDTSPPPDPVFSPSHYMEDQYWPEDILNARR